MRAPAVLTSRSDREIVVAVLVLGLLVRLVLAFATYGDQYDMTSHVIVEKGLRADFLQIYGSGRWPYPPGFFPELLVSGLAARASGLPFHGVVQVWPIVADLGIAVLVADVLLRRGATRTTRLASVAVVALGPLFIEVSGFHGQIDTFALLPAVAAVWWWERNGSHRALVAGLLIGLGAATKTVPGIVALALLPTVRDRREAATLLVAAVAVPVATLLPFAAADLHQVAKSVGTYRGVAGQGGMSLLVQPDLALAWIGGDRTGGYSDASLALRDASGLFTALGLLLTLLVAVLLVRRRVRGPESAVLLFLAGLATGPNLLYQYTLWILPFALMAGWLGPAVALQLLGAVSGFLIGTGTHYGAQSPWDRPVVYGVFVPVTILVWLCFVGALAYGVRRLLVMPPRAGPVAGTAPA